MKVVGLGLVLVIVTAFGGLVAAGGVGFRAAGLAGLLGFGAHLVAATIIRRNLKADLKALAGAFAAGMAIRLGGAAMAFAAVRFDDGFFPAVPTLFGYVTVLMPMLFMEIRFLK